LQQAQGKLLDLSGLVGRVQRQKNFCQQVFGLPGAGLNAFAFVVDFFFTDFDGA